MFQTLCLKWNTHNDFYYLDFFFFFLTLRIDDDGAGWGKGVCDYDRAVTTVHEEKDQLLSLWCRNKFMSEEWCYCCPPGFFFYLLAFKNGHESRCLSGSKPIHLSLFIYSFILLSRTSVVLVIFILYDFHAFIPMKTWF